MSKVYSIRIFAHVDENSEDISEYRQSQKISSPTQQVAIKAMIAHTANRFLMQESMLETAFCVVFKISQKELLPFSRFDEAVTFLHKFEPPLLN